MLGILLVDEMFHTYHISYPYSWSWLWPEILGLSL